MVCKSVEPRLTSVFLQLAEQFCILCRSTCTVQSYIPCLPLSLQLSFDECFHEHKSTKTYPVVYQFMGLVYQYTKLGVYHFFVLTLGLLLAFLWAIINGVMAFVHTWIYNPALKAILLWVYAITPLFTEPLRAIFKPLVDVSARIFRQIRISTNFSGGVGWYSHTKTNQV